MVVFLEGVKAALTADAAFQGGWYEKKPGKGLRAGDIVSVKITAADEYDLVGRAVGTVR